MEISKVFDRKYKLMSCKLHTVCRKNNNDISCQKKRLEKISKKFQVVKKNCIGWGRPFSRYLSWVRGRDCFHHIWGSISKSVTKDPQTARFIELFHN